MKKNTIGVFLIITVTLSFQVFFNTGCISRKSLSQDLHRRRTAAYHQWAKIREAEKGSQTIISGSLHLVDAIKLAIQQNKTLKIALQEKEIARGKILESYSQALPKISSAAPIRILRKSAPLMLGAAQFPWEHWIITQWT